MKLVRYLIDGTAREGVLDGHAIREFESSYGVGQPPTSTVRQLSEVELLPAVRPSAKIICVGLNYADHAEEAGAQAPAQPLLFSKTPNTLTADGKPILIPDKLTQKVDYEAELGVVIRRHCSRIDVDQALDYVLGYTCVNDVSARDLQFADGQWFRGKSLDTFCPVGPSITTTEDIQNPQNLSVRAAVNGQTLQDSNTARMIFPVADLISYISQTIALEPGDLIATGTPAGVGITREPPVLLTPGDTVTIEIEHIGRLTNPVETVGQSA